MVADTQVIDYSPSDEDVMVEVLKSFTTPEEIEALEGELLNAETVNIHVQHGFCKGVYSRKIVLPAGIIAIGHAHSDECLNIVTSGSVSVVIDGIVRRITGPCEFVSPPGHRKIGFVHEDCTWFTIHATDKKDIAELELDLIIKSPTFRRYELANPTSTEIANCPRDEFWIDRVDYFNLLKELGVSHEEARRVSEKQDDQIEFPAGAGNSVYVGSSVIQGSGLFAAFDAVKGDVLCPARIGTKRTKAGRYTNHSRYPNCKFVADQNGDINLVANADIRIGDELTVDYRQAKKTASIADSFLNLNTQ
jgi:hypothetical protein